MSFEKCWIWRKAPKIQRPRVVHRGDIVKYDSGFYAVFTEQGWSASQMTAAKVMDITSRLPGCSGQAAYAVSAHTQVKIGDAHTLLNSKIGVSRQLDSSTTTHMAKIMVQYGRPSRFLLSGICVVTFWKDYSGKGNLRKSFWSTVGRRFPIGIGCSYIVLKRILLFCVCGWHQIGWERNKIFIRCEKYWTKKLIWGEPTSFLDHVYLVCTQRQCETSKDIVDNYRTMFESRISAGESR